MYAFGKRKRIGFWDWKNSSKWLSCNLDKRIRLFNVAQAESEEGGFDHTYNFLKEIWAGCTTLSHNSYMRWSSTENIGNISHEIVIRKNAVDDLHSEFTSAFGTVFDNIADINPIKSNMFIMLLSTSNTGKFFRARRVMDKDENGEYLSILCEEIEEFGTGAPNQDEDGVL